MARLGRNVHKERKVLDRLPARAASAACDRPAPRATTSLGIRASLKRTLESTDTCESMIKCVRRQSSDMAFRWTAADMLEAERQFPRIIACRDLAKLAVAIERDLRHTGTAVTKFHDKRDILCRADVTSTRTTTATRS